MLRPGGHMLFSIRDDMLVPETDQGCGFQTALNQLVESGKMTHVDSIGYAKYKGLELGPCMSETPAQVKIYKKL